MLGTERNRYVCAIYHSHLQWMFFSGVIPKKHGATQGWFARSSEISTADVAVSKGWIASVWEMSVVSFGVGGLTVLNGTIVDVVWHAVRIRARLTRAIFFMRCFYSYTQSILWFFTASLLWRVGRVSKIMITKLQLFILGFIFHRPINLHSV